MSDIESVPRPALSAELFLLSAKVDTAGLGEDLRAELDAIIQEVALYREYKDVATWTSMLADSIARLRWVWYPASEPPNHSRPVWVAHLSQTGASYSIGAFSEGEWRFDDGSPWGPPPTHWTHLPEIFRR